MTTTSEAVGAVRLSVFSLSALYFVAHFAESMMTLGLYTAARVPLHEG